MSKLQDFFKCPYAIRLIAIATFISNIGNGMNLIAISKLAYDQTKSAVIFGGVIVVQYVVMFLVQFFSGAIVDKNNPKKIIIVSDIIRGILVLSSGCLCLVSKYGLGFLAVSILIINIVNPFFNAGNFCIIPKVVDDKEMLLKTNGIITTLFQAGQLCGSASVAVIIYFTSPAVALIIDGLTFFMSATIFLLVPFKYEENRENSAKISIPQIIREIFHDWKNMGKCIKKEKTAIFHLFFASGDYLAVNFFNVMLVPLVANFYNDNSFTISLYDCGFAIGSMLSVFFIELIVHKFKQNNAMPLGIIMQAIVLFILSLKIHFIFAFGLIIVYGISNALSITIYSSNLQSRCEENIVGKVNSIKCLIVSVLTIVLVPIVSQMYDKSIQFGLLGSSGILLIYGVLAIILSRKFAYGEELLTRPLKSNEI